MRDSFYSSKLKDPRWQRRRLEVLQRDEFTCRMCGDSKSTLHVHHKRYVKGRQPWEYEGRDLVSVCEACHEDAHQVMYEAIQLMASLSLDNMPWSIQSVLPVVAGFAGATEKSSGMDLFQIHPREYMAGEIARRLLRMGAGDLLDLLVLLDSYEPMQVVGAARAALHGEDARAYRMGEVM